MVCLRADLNTHECDVKLGGVIGCEMMRWWVMADLDAQAGDMKLGGVIEDFRVAGLKVQR